MMYNETVQDDISAEPQELGWQPFDEYGFTSPWAPRLLSIFSSVNYFMSACVITAAAILFVVFCEQCRHWAQIPLVLCGIITLADIVAWARGEIDIYDIKAIVSGYLLLNTFVAPEIHLGLNIMTEQLTMPDPGRWFGYMAIFNFCGLILFKLAQNYLFNRAAPAKKFWQLNPVRFMPILVVFLSVSFAATLVVQVVFGGLYEVLGATQAVGGAGGLSAQLSWILMLADPLVFLVAIAIVFWWSLRLGDRPATLAAVMLILIIAFASQFLLAGERSSRMALLTVLLAITGIIHYRLRRFTVKFILVGVIIVFVFSYLYDYRKKLGPAGWEAFYSSEARQVLSIERGGSSPVTTLTGDFARADVHAYLLFCLMENPGSYQLAKGGTYAMSLLTFIPRGIWPTKPKNPKLEVGSAILGYSPLRESTRQYGLVGESMLNFNYYGIIPVFILYGLAVGWFRKKVATLEPTDARFFLIPIIFITFALTVNTDSDNLSFNLLKLGVLPFILIYLSSYKFYLH